MDLRWFVDEVESIAQRLQVRHELTREVHQELVDHGPIENGLLSMQLEELELNGAASSPAEEEDSTDMSSTRRRSKWSTEGPIQFATEPTDHNGPNPTAFEIPITPPSKSTSKSPLRRNKTTTPKAPRPHTIHVDGGGDVPHITSRPRTNSDSNEQDENKPPVSL